MKENIKKEKETKISTPQKRFDNIDLLKTIAIFMVVCLHIPIFSTDIINHNEISNIVQYSFRLIFEGVLIFIFINGFLLINKPFDLKKHIKKIIKIFILLLLWGTVNVIIKSFIRGEVLSLDKIIDSVLTIKLIHPYSGALWFLQNLIGLYIIFPIIKIVHDNNKKIYKYLFITVAIFSIGINLLDISTQLIATLTKQPDLVSKVLNIPNKINPYSNNMFLFYFMLGGFIFENKDWFENSKSVLISCIIGFISWIIAICFGLIISILQNETFANNYNYEQIFLVFTIIGMYGLSTLYVNKNNNIINKFITSVGRNTMGIYLIHTFIIEIINKNMYIWQFDFWIRLLIAFGVFLASWIISLIIMKIPKFNNIIKI